MTNHPGIRWGSWFLELTIFLTWVGGLIFTLISILAASMTVWRLGADPGWTRPFFLEDGVLSRYPAWIAITIAAQTGAFILKRRVAVQASAPRIAASSEPGPRTVPAPRAAAAAV